MLNPYLTPPPRVWPSWIRTVTICLAIGWVTLMLWYILAARASDLTLAEAGSETFLSELRVALVIWSALLTTYLVAICAALGLDMIATNFSGTLAPVVAFPVHLALGLGVFSVLFFVLGLIPGGYGLWPLVAVLLAGGIVVIRWHRYRPILKEEVFEKPPETVLWFFLVTALMIIAMAAAVAPPTAGNDLAFHLHSPAYQLQQGRLIPPSWCANGHFPNLMQHIDVPLMAFDPLEAAPRMLNVVLGVLIAYTLYRIGGIWFSPRAGGIAGLLFLTTPVTLDVWSSAAPDMAGAFFVTVAMLVLLISPMNRAAAHARLAGVIAGLAVAAQLTALSSVVGLYVFVAARWWRYRSDTWQTIGMEHPGLLRMLLAFTWPVLLVQVPFLTFAWIATGNPIYPFLFGGVGWTKEMSHQVLEWQRNQGMGTGVRDFFALPWRLVASGGAAMGRFEGALHPWYLILTPLALGWPRHWKKIVLLLMMLGVTVAVWLHMGQSARYLLPALPWAALIGGMGFDSLVRAFPKTSRAWVSGALGLLMAGTGVFMLQPRDLERFSDNVMVSLTRTETREEYLRRYLDLYPAIEWVNATLDPEADKVLMLWDNRGHQLDVPWIADTFPVVPQVFDRWNRMTTDQIVDSLHEEGVTHLMVNVVRRSEMLADDNHPITEAIHAQVWAPLLEHLEEVHAVGPMRIYRVISE